MRAALFVFVLLFPVFASAAERGDTALFIGDEVCQWAKANASAAVSPNGGGYKPGETVDGKPVAPADIQPPGEVRMENDTQNLLRQITIEITSDIAMHLGIPNSLIRQRLTVGAVEMNAQGEPTVNGQKLVDPDPDAWVDACNQALGK